MARRTLPAVLGLGALIADAAGSHGFGLAFALECYGDALEGRCGLARSITAGGALLLLVFSAALRSPAVVGGVPQLAVSALVVTLMLYAAISLGALLQGGRTVPESA
jgi:hypothetical protein